MGSKILPTEAVAIRLASIVVHAEEYIGPDPHVFDAVAIRSLLNDPETRVYLDRLAKLALLPVKRT